MAEMDDFNARNRELINRMGQDAELKELALRWISRAARYEYTHHFTWLGRPIIQLPQDIIAMQELIWRVRPDLIIETGVARGGSLIFYASILELIGEPARVLGIDIDIRAHNRAEIEKHPLFKRIDLLEGSSIDPALVQRVHAAAAGKSRVMVLLDSNHTHDHVLTELRAYEQLVTTDSYLVVFDTLVEDMPEDAYPNRPWGKGNNPKTAVRQFLRETSRFVVDSELEDKLGHTVAPEGYLKCIGDGKAG